MLGHVRREHRRADGEVREERARRRPRLAAVMRQPPSTRVAVVAGSPPRAGLPISASAWQLLISQPCSTLSRRTLEPLRCHSPDTSEPPRYCRCMFAASPADPSARDTFSCATQASSTLPPSPPSRSGTISVRYRVARRSSTHSASSVSPGSNHHPRSDPPRSPAQQPPQSAHQPESRRSPRSKSISE